MVLTGSHLGLMLFGTAADRGHQAVHEEVPDLDDAGLLVVLQQRPVGAVTVHRRVEDLEAVGKLGECVGEGVEIDNLKVRYVGGDGLQARTNIDPGRQQILTKYTPGKLGELKGWDG